VALAAVVSNVLAVLVLLLVIDLLGAIPRYRDGLASGPRLLRLEHQTAGTPARALADQGD
jgi:hypothetical protein